MFSLGKLVNFFTDACLERLQSLSYYLLVFLMPGGQPSYLCDAAFAYGQPIYTQDIALQLFLGACLAVGAHGLLTEPALRYGFFSSIIKRNTFHVLVMKIPTEGAYVHVCSFDDGHQQAVKSK